MRLKRSVSVVACPHQLRDRARCASVTDPRTAGAMWRWPVSNASYLSMPMRRILDTALTVQARGVHVVAL